MFSSFDKHQSQRFAGIKMGPFFLALPFFECDFTYFQLILVDLPNREHRYNKNLDMYVKSIGACLNGKHFCLNRSSFRFRFDQFHSSHISYSKANIFRSQKVSVVLHCFRLLLQG